MFDAILEGKTIEEAFTIKESSQRQLIEENDVELF
jgi:hypothetical protein